MFYNYKIRQSLSMLNKMHKFRVSPVQIVARSALLSPITIPKININQLYGNISQKRSLNFTSKYQFTSQNNIQPEDMQSPKLLYQRYITDAEEKQKKSDVKLYRSFGEKPFLRLSIPRNYHIQPQNTNQSAWQKIFTQQITPQNPSTNQKHIILLLNADTSKLIHSKRSFTLKHLEQNIYQGLAQAPRLLTEYNPDNYMGIQQIQFSEDIFLCTDDKIGEQMKQYLQYLQQAQQEQRQIENDIRIKQIQQKINKLYQQQQPLRLRNRLLDEYNVPKNMCKIIQQTMSTLSKNSTIKNKVDIFFVGINQYALRNILTNILSLQQIKQLFMRSLHYSKLMISKRIKNNHSPSNNPSPSNFNHSPYTYQQLCRQLIYTQNYDKLYKLQNGQIVRKAKQIQLWKKKQLHLQKQQKLGWSVQRLKNKLNQYIGTDQPNDDIQMILLANQPTVLTLNHSNKYKYDIVHDLHHFKYEKKIIKDNKENTTKQQGKQQSSQHNNDYVRLQKHAILDVMLGKLWLSKVTNNKFPFLSEEYKSLSQPDQQNVDKVFRQIYVKYLGAKNVYWNKNINPLFQNKQQSIQ